MKFNLVEAVVVLLILGCSTIRDTNAKPPMIIDPVNPNDPPTLPEGSSKKALVIGAGLAGLSASIELADRGYQVTLKEAFDRVGGKLFCTPVEIFPNETFNVEHGFHAWFNAYYQFKDIRDRLGINGNFRVWPKVHFVYRDYKPEVLYSSGPYPLNLLEIIQRSPNLKLSDAILSSLSLKDLLYFDFSTVFDKYDNISFADWAKEKHVQQDFYDIIMQPSLSVTLNERDIFSAAEMLNFMQIYFLTNAEADHREVANINYKDAILDPWKNYLLAKNVKIELETSVKHLKIDTNSISVTGSVDEKKDDPTRYDHVVFAADVGAVQKIMNATYDQYRTSARTRKVLQTVGTKSINRMKIAPDYKVLRLWFDKQMNESAPDILETPDYTPINLIAQYSLLEKEYIDWAQRTGGSVVEFHCYTWSKYFPRDTPDELVWHYISPTVKAIYPEIFERNFNVLATHVNSYQNFASFEVGLNSFRPNATTFVDYGLNNLYIAGDWIRTPFPSALMERAVSTGRRAANEILLKDGVRQASLTVVNLKGPGL